MSRSTIITGAKAYKNSSQTRINGKAFSNSCPKRFKFTPSSFTCAVVPLPSSQFTRISVLALAFQDDRITPFRLHQPSLPPFINQSQKWTLAHSFVRPKALGVHETISRKLHILDMRSVSTHNGGERESFTSQRRASKEQTAIAM
jgi:hypothetical protein